MKQQILKTWLIAGSLDITAACVQAYVSKAVTPDRVLEYIASGIFGKAAYTGGIEYILTGLLVHFLIALACVVGYYFLYPKIKLLQQNVLLSALLVALVAWTVTTRIIVPMSKIQPPPFDIVKALTAVAILYVCIGLPIAWFAKQYYRKRSN